MEKKPFAHLGFSQKNLGGFTLIEVLITVAIILIMSTILVPGYKAFQYQFSLLRSAHKLAQDLRKAQEMATSARELEGTVPPGYGIRLKMGDEYYVLYADTNPQQGNEEFDSGDTIVETIYLESKVYIKEVSPSSVSINFRGPDPTTKISGGSSLVAITLSLEMDSTKIQKINANKGGLIYVE